MKLVDVLPYIAEFISKCEKKGVTTVEQLKEKDMKFFVCLGMYDIGNASNLDMRKLGSVITMFENFNKGE